MTEQAHTGRDKPPVSGRTRSVKVASLARRHVGRDFVGLGILTQISIRENGTWLHAGDGLCLCVREDLQLDYYLTEAELQRQHHRPQADA